jgi:Fe-S-cluster containining protein
MRQCNECQECCNGNLQVNVLGYEISKGNPCRFLCSSGCSIHKSRPEVCRSFNCLWKMDESIPEDLYPKNSGVIMMYKKLNGYTFVLVRDFHNKMSKNQKESIIKWAKKRQKNCFIVKDTELICAPYGNKDEIDYIYKKLFGEL